ncbi:Heparan-alpha-glucosaminide N-acetyltransferase [Coccomyxa sp. Obi]|nr:Heparan-alpha-glucosaminide N-acetyltransferase [Coccomyxa sp. Obi]
MSRRTISRPLDGLPQYQGDANLETGGMPTPFANEIPTLAQHGVGGRPGGPFLRKADSKGLEPPDAPLPRMRFLDIARGCTVALMIFVNHAGHGVQWIAHAAWDGVHLADLVMPSFLVLLGASVALSLVSKSSSPRRPLLQKVLARAGKLAGLGLLIQGGAATGAFPAWDLSRLRYFGVLQRIALCFLLVSLVVLYLPPCPDLRLQALLDRGDEGASLMAPLKMYAQWWMLATAMFVVFNGVALLLRPPGCTEAPALTPDCNMTACIDAWLLGQNHLYPYPSCRRADPPCAYLDPEGLFATLSGAVASTFLGLWYGTVLLALRGHRARLKSWAYASTLLIELGLALHVTGIIPFNKNLYSASFVLLTAGSTGVLLGLLYLLTEVAPSSIFERASAPFMWLGMNSFAVYVGDEVLEKAIPWVYWGNRDAHLLSVVEAAFRGVLGEGPMCRLALAAADVVFWMVIAGMLHRKQWYAKV